MTQPAIPVQQVTAWARTFLARAPIVEAEQPAYRAVQDMLTHIDRNASAATSPTGTETATPSKRTTRRSK